MAILRRLQVILDLEEISDYIAQHSSSASLRFLDAAQDTFQFLERFPLVGRACRFRDPRMSDVRKRTIQGFKKYVVYYRPTAEGVEILRVVHGARDRGELLGEEFD
jgi:toxin ParE1/3/4